MTVLIGHVYKIWFPGIGVHTAEVLAHGAVVVFFVLSGFVIAFSTTKSNRGIRQYSIARLSRLYSVVLPALCITALIQFYLLKTEPQLLSHYTKGDDFFRYLLAGTFTNELWFFSAAPLLNQPLWSLSFEFWYYAIFGAWIYRKSNITGWLLFALVCLVAGPKIIVMMPIWLIGCMAYWKKGPGLSKTVSWIISVSLLLVSVLLVRYLPGWPFRIGSPPFFFANQFITDFLIGCIIGLSLWFLPLYSKFKTIPPAIKVIRTMADLTFPIYVLHYPLLVLFQHFFVVKELNIPQFLLAAISITLVASLVGFILESQRKYWITFFTWLANLTKNSAKKISHLRLIKIS
jgi:peptidoglycan/LPS O-acetylase OafA/YrhL